MPNHGYFANLIWQIADLLRGPYRPPQYERVMLPLTVLRRFDCVLAPTKAEVLDEHARLRDRLDGDALDLRLNIVSDQRFHNRSPLDFQRLKGDPDNVARHLASYIGGFSANVRRIFEYFEFESEIEKMNEAGILYLVLSRFSGVDLHPDIVPNEQMGLIFENLIRRFNELANETAGDHFTPREVIRLMVNILFMHDDELLATPGIVRTLLDPACGTGGMLAEAQNYLRAHHPEARLFVYGQDYNRRAFATAASDMLMKQVDHNSLGENIRFGDSFTDDQFEGRSFDYLIPTRLSASTGRSSADSSGTSTRVSGAMDDSMRGSRASAMARCCSCSTWSTSSSRCARMTASTARGWRSCSTVRHCSQAVPGRVRATFAGG